ANGPSIGSQLPLVAAIRGHEVDFTDSVADITHKSKVAPVGRKARAGIALHAGRGGQWLAIPRLHRNAVKTIATALALLVGNDNGLTIRRPRRTMTTEEWI